MDRSISIESHSTTKWNDIHITSKLIPNQNNNNNFVIINLGICCINGCSNKSGRLETWEVEREIPRASLHHSRQAGRQAASE